MPNKELRTPMDSGISHVASQTTDGPVFDPDGETDFRKQMKLRLSQLTEVFYGTSRFISNHAGQNEATRLFHNAVRIVREAADTSNPGETVIYAAARKLPGEDEIRRLLNEGKTLEDIGRMYDTSRQAVSGICIRHKIDVPGQKRGPPGPEDPDQIASDYLGGMTYPELEKKYGTSSDTISNILDKYGIKRRNPGPVPEPIPEDLYDEIYQLYVIQNMSMEEIGERLGKNAMWVSTRMKKLGIHARPTGPRSQSGDSL